MAHDFVDVPMSLGDHLHELRSRLIMPLICLAALFFGAFAFENRLQVLFAQPLVWAIGINPDHAKAVGLPIDGSLPRLAIHGIWEAPLASMKVSFYTAFFLAFPVLVYQLWMFIGVGLVHRERRLAFLFVPAGIMFFYAGTLVGYFIGLPYFYSFMIKWAAHNPLAEFQLQLQSYHQDFIRMTMVFGLVADIPWLVMVLVRTGFVSVAQLLKNWKIAIFGCTAVAAVIAPPDAFSMVVVMIPLYGLFFLGVGLSALMMRHHRRLEEKEAAAETARMAEEERAAHEAQVPREDPATAGAPSTVVHADPAQPQADETAETVPISDPQPISRDAITDDLAAGDDAPSSDDQPAEDPQDSASQDHHSGGATMTPGGDASATSSPTEPPPRLGNDESGTGGETPRKDDDRG